MVTPVSPGNSTVAFIRRKVRRLTSSPSESDLSTANIDEYINNFYNFDFPYAIKIDQTRSVYTFFTRPNIDRYPLDVNYNQGVRAPVYFEGILGTLFKDRGQFYNIWPRWPTLFQQGGTNLSGTITGATNANPCQITSPLHGLSTGAVISITGVLGMTQINDSVFTITVIDANNFTIGVDSTAFGVYAGGGTWSAVSQAFSFTVPAPFLSKEVVIGGIGADGVAFSINDNGNGILQILRPNAVTTVPAQTQFPTAPIPGMLNNNTGNPGLYSPLNIGTVDYITGQFDFSLPSGVSLGQGELLTIWVSQYQPGRSYSMLYWNNEITVRPVPDRVYKVEVETYLTPVQFMLSSDNPILNQWAEYISYGAALEIMRDRQDSEAVATLMEGFKRQEGLVLERQGIEEIGTPNYQLFNSTQPYTVYGGWGQGQT